MGRAAGASASAGVGVEAVFGFADTLRVQALCAYHRPGPEYCDRDPASSVAVAAAGHVFVDLTFDLRHPSMESQVDGVFWAAGARKSLITPHLQAVLANLFGRWLVQSEEPVDGPCSHGRLGEGGRVPMGI